MEMGRRGRSHRSQGASEPGSHVRRVSGYTPRQRSPACAAAKKPPVERSGVARGPAAPKLELTGESAERGEAGRYRAGRGGIGGRSGGRSGVRSGGGRVNVEPAGRGGARPWADGPMGRWADGPMGRWAGAQTSARTACHEGLARRQVVPRGAASARSARSLRTDDTEAPWTLASDDRNSDLHQDDPPPCGSANLARSAKVAGPPWTDVPVPDGNPSFAEGEPLGSWCTEPLTFLHP